MIITCGACGKEMEIEGRISDGQHICCPFCGEKTVYRKPTRIELPPKKPKIGIRRPDDLPGDGVDLNAQAIMRQLELKKEDLESIGAQAVSDWKKAEQARLLRLGLIVLIIAGLVVGGTFWYLGAKREREAERTLLAEKSRLEEEQAKQDQAAEMAKADARAAKRAAERQQLEEEANRRKEATKQRLEKMRQKRAEEEAKWKAEQERNEAELAARKKKAEAERAAIDRYCKMNDSLRDLTLRPWTALAREKRPGAVDGTFVCTMRVDGNRSELYEIASKTGGKMTVVRLDSNGACVPVAFADYERRLNENGGLVLTDEKAYLFAPKERSKPVPLSVDRGFNPSMVRLGRLCDEIYGRRMNTENLAFEVTMNLAGNKTPVTIGTVGFDEVIEGATITGVLRSVADVKVGQSKPEKAAKKTVVMYDGKIIKRQMNGVTLVPRDPSRHTSEWDALRNEAIRQERCEREGRRDQVNKKYAELEKGATLTVTICEGGRR